MHLYSTCDLNSEEWKICMPYTLLFISRTIDLRSLPVNLLHTFISLPDQSLQYNLSSNTVTENG